MAIWKTKWGWRADFVFKGERVIAKGFFKYKDDARQWIKDEKQKRKERWRSFSLAKQDTSFWYLAQKYLSLK